MNTALQAAQEVWDYAVPPDYYDDYIAREKAGEAAFKEYLETGHLPGMLDAGTVDEMLLDRMPDCLHELTIASQKIHCRDEFIKAVASKIAAMRQEIIDELIDEALSEK